MINDSYNQIDVKIVHKNDTYENWTKNNPVLLNSEIGYDTTNKKIKIGDGATNWNSLPYYDEDYINEKIAELVDTAPETLNTLNELARALGDDPNFATTIANQIGNKVDKIEGMGLSANNFTNSEKEKLANLSKIPINNGTGKNSIVINDGEANGEYSVAGGVTDKSVIESLVGSVAASLVKVDKAKANGIMSLSYGVNTETQTSGSMALGVDNIVGVKGYYWHTIDFINKTITLSTNRPTTLSGSVKAPSNLDWEVGDYISITNESNYPFCTKITAITGNIITVESLPFKSNPYDTKKTILGQEVIVYPAVYATPYNRTIYAVYRDEYISVLDKTIEHWAFRNGIVELGFGGTAIGALNKVSGLVASAKGFENFAVGDYSEVSGSHNIAGEYASARGFWTKALGRFSTTDGRGTEALGEAQYVHGKYNILDPSNKYIEIAGNGKNEDNRSNAYTLDWNGNAWYAGNVDATDGNFSGNVSGTNANFSGYVTDGSGNRLIDSNTAINNAAKCFGEEVLINGDNYVEYFNALGIKDYSITGNGAVTTYDESTNSYYLPITCGVKENIKAVDGDKYLLIESPTAAIAHRFIHLLRNDNTNIVEIGHSYTFTAWCKTKKGTNTVKTHISSSALSTNTIMPTQTKASAVTINSNEWTKVIGTFNIIEATGDKTQNNGFHLGVEFTSSNFSDIYIDNYCLVDNENPDVNLLEHSIAKTNSKYVKCDYMFEGINGTIDGLVNGTASFVEGGTADYIPSSVTVNIPVDAETFTGTLNYVNDSLPELPAFFGYTSTYTLETTSDVIFDLVCYSKINSPTKVSQLENDIGYLTEHQDISGKADVNHKHPEYLTEHQDISIKADIDHTHTGEQVNVTLEILDDNREPTGESSTISLNEFVNQVVLLEGRTIIEGIINEIDIINTDKVNKSELETKADKTIIQTDTEATEYAFDFSDMYNKEMRLQSASSISIKFADNEYANDYISGLSFNSGETPTGFDYADSGIINWVGTDCVKNGDLSIFQPSANTHYDIVFYFNGVQFIGLVNGFVPAIGNEAV